MCWPGGRGGHVQQVQEGGRHRLHPARPAAQAFACWSLDQNSDPSLPPRPAVKEGI